MMLWILLIVIIFLIALILAVKSMRGYKLPRLEKPRFSFILSLHPLRSSLFAEDYNLLRLHPRTKNAEFWRSGYKSELNESSKEMGLFLIRKPSHLSDELINKIWANLGNHTISLERIVRGRESALLIFGPSVILNNFQDDLNLLEIEDYIDNKPAKSLWEYTLIHPSQMENLFEDFPYLSQNDQFSLQVVLAPNKEQGMFNLGIRAAYLSDEIKPELLARLENLSPNLAKLPKDYPNQEILSSYQSRILTKGESIIRLDWGQILKLIRL